MRSIYNDILNAFRKSNNQPVQLILICCMLFFFGIISIFVTSFLPNAAFLKLFIIENTTQSTNLRVALTHPWTFFLFPFTNPGFLSLLFNCLSIFWFGNLLSDFLGSKKTILIFYFGSLFSAIFYFCVFLLVSTFSKNTVDTKIIYGCSSGIYAVLFATVALLPDYEIGLFGRIFIKLKYLALTFLLLSFVMPNIGLLNLGGAIYGYLSIKFLRGNFNIFAPIERVTSWFSRPKKKTFQKTYSKTTVGEYHNEEFNSLETKPGQEEIDFLLDKISTNGYESLSKDEKQRLYMASQSKG
jgi:membrane associated rhomboid family serine protease